jgi:hypothetical protein
MSNIETLHGRTRIDVSNDVLPMTYLSPDNTEYIGDQYFVYQILDAALAGIEA